MPAPRAIPPRSRFVLVFTAATLLCVGVVAFVIRGQGSGRVVPQAAIPTVDSGARAEAAEAAARGSLERGRRIYKTGQGEPGQEIDAVLGSSNAPTAAASLACAGCHGDDGRGRAEGGIEPPALTWGILTNPAGARDRFGRTRPPYDRALLSRAIALGIDPAGRDLGPGMPRYRLSIDQMSDLLAYLECLGTDPASGVDDREIRIGTIVPSGSTTGRVILETLEARLGQINRDGGLYGRRLVLRARDLPESPGEAVAAAAAFLGQEHPFALISPFAPGIEEPLGRLVSDREVPTIGLLTPDPDDQKLNRWVFYVQSGLVQQAEALARFAAISTPSQELAVVQGPGSWTSRAADAAARAWERETGRSAKTIASGPGDDSREVIARVRESGCLQIVILGSSRLLHDLGRVTSESDWKPTLLGLGATSGPELFQLPEACDGRIILALPLLATDLTGFGAANYERLERESSLSRDHLATRLSVLASVEVFLEALSRCGRELNAHRLVSQLESLRQFQCGYAPPLSFGTSERIGTRGAHLLTIDFRQKQLRPLKDWIPARSSR